VTTGRDTAGHASPTEPSGERFPHLHQLFGGHLFQGWYQLCDTPEEAIADTVASSSVERLSHALTELEELRSLKLSELELEAVLLHELSCHCVDEEGTSARWLDHVAAQLREGLILRQGDTESGASA
jgi:hypothetical protein